MGKQSVSSHRIGALIIGAVCTLIAAPALSQWLNEPTRNLPRSTDGKVELNAAAPRTAQGRPDLSGQWRVPLHPGYVINIAADLDRNDVDAEAARTFRSRLDDFGKDDPSTIGCMPMGPRHITAGGIIQFAKFIQTSELIVVLYEDMAYRQIHMDGRTLPVNPHPSFMGYSIGRWEGDVLIVESNGFKDATWLDFGGHPHTEKLRMIERYKRTSLGEMQREVTIIDPDTFKRPITIAATMTLAPDTELLEYVCAETPRERFGLVGRTEAERKVRVPRDVLATYVGTYEFTDAVAFGIRTVTVTLEQEELFIDFNGKGRTPLIAMSQTLFSPRLLGTYEFVQNEKGTVTHLLAHGAESTVRADRRN